tara:strand:+ start:378 stop:755 length:378 start_codon:yes stop_codon:yes gene_type:complete
MGFRCELCDEWLPMLQFSKLCPTCYKIRTIVKCYSADEILKHLEKNFLVSNDKYEERKQKDEKFFVEEEKRLEKEFNDEIRKLQEEQKKLKPIQEEADDKVDYDKPPPPPPLTRKQKKQIHEKKI